MILSAGNCLGPYAILAALEAGGVGEVDRARDPTFRRVVARMLLPDLFADDPERLGP